MALGKSVAIIGGGISGTLCALLLAKKGYEVSIVEKQKQLGGLFSVFKREGLTFDVGFHYAGSLHKDSFLFESLKSLNILKESDIEILSYPDKLIINNKEIKVGGGIEEFTNLLKKNFPEEDKIDDFIDKLVTTALKFYKSDLSESLILDSQNLKGVLDYYFKSYEIKKIISYISYFYGSMSDEGQFSVHSLLLYDILTTPAKIKGGSKTVIDNIIKQLKEYNVEIITGNKVEKILVDNSGNFKGLKINNGTNLYSDYCISTIHPINILKLLDGKTKNEQRLIAKINKKVNGHTAFSTYFKFKGSIDTNYYYFNEDLEMELILLYGEKYDEYQSIISLIATDWDEWNQIKNDKEKVKDLKKSYEEKTLNLLKKYNQDIKDFEILDSASPLTFERYTDTFEGSYYGLRCNAQDKGIYSLLPFTKIKNFYIAGQSIFYPGLMGCYCTSAIVVNYIDNKRS
jgi:phytoene dehydrogenase-like protein